MRRSVHFYALDVDRDRYSYMSMAMGSLMASVRERARCPTRLTSTFKEPEMVAAEHVKEHVTSIFKTYASGGASRGDLAMGAFIWNDALVRELVPRLRQSGFEGRIILGGPQVTHAPGGTLEEMYPGVDIFIRGEAEDAIAAVVASDSAVEFTGVHYAGTEDADRVAVVEDLGALPSPYVTTIPTIPAEFNGRARWETKRGCPYACAFCQHRKAGGGVRYFSQERLAAEIRHFISVGR